MAKKKKRANKKSPPVHLLLLLLMVLILLAVIGWKLGAVKNTGEQKRPEIKIQKLDAAPAGLSETKPKIVFVIDDIGYHLEHLKILTDLGDQVTYAILPLLPYSRYFGNLSEKTGAEVILHLPLEAMDGTIPGRGLITRSMSPSHVLEMLSRNLASVPNHTGVNNHMGSLGTSDPVLMTLLLSELKIRKLFFLDSQTSPHSVVPEVGRQVSIPVLIRDVFLDNIDAKQAIRGQIRLLKGVARSKGYAVAIGHYRANTLEVLLEEIPRLEEEGFEITSLRNLLAFLEWKKQKSRRAGLEQ